MFIKITVPVFVYVPRRIYDKINLYICILLYVNVQSAIVIEEQTIYQADLY